MEPMIGEIRVFPYNFIPRGWILCDGSSLAVSQFSAFYSIIGNRFGGDNQKFNLPNMNGRAPMGAGQDPGLSARKLGDTGGEAKVTLKKEELPAHTHEIKAYAPTGTAADTINPEGNYLAEVSGQNLYGAQAVSGAPKSMELQGTVDQGAGVSHNNMQPYLVLKYCISYEGLYPPRPESGGFTGGENFLGEIIMFAGDYAPKGWALCDGSTVSINDNQALFALIGTTYGGDGITTFRLPDMRGRIPVHVDNAGKNGRHFILGQTLGSETATLLPKNLPPHNHMQSSGLNLKKYVNSFSSGDSANPNGRYAAIDPKLKQYGKTKSAGKTAPLLVGQSEAEGNNSPHNNIQPFTCINFIIAIHGIYPSFE